jgi:hypothetical protein
MRSLDQAVLHGDESPDVVSRLLESSRYAASISKLAHDAGMPDPAPVAGLVPLQQASTLLVAALMSVMSDLIGALVPPETRSGQEVLWVDELHVWARDALKAAVNKQPRPLVPPRPVIIPVVEDAGRSFQRAERPSSPGVVDAEIVVDDVVDAVTDESGDDDLVHDNGRDFEADDRVGARLVDADGRVLAERVPPPRRGRSPLVRSVLPWAGSKRVAADQVEPRAGWR